MFKLPQDIFYSIFDFLELSNLVSMKRVSKKWNRLIQDYYQKLTTQFYFAIGQPVPLYDFETVYPMAIHYDSYGNRVSYCSYPLAIHYDSYGNHVNYCSYPLMGDKPYEVRSKHIPKSKELLLSRNNYVKLFHNLEAALCFRDASAQETAELDKSWDWYFPRFKAPIYVVRIYNPRPGNLLKTSYEKYNNSDFTILKCHKAHLKKVYYAKLHDYFFLSQPNHKSKNNLYAQFQALWEQGFPSSAPKTNFEKRVQGSLKALFQSYSAPIYSKLTRHHHREIRGILAYLETSPSLEKLDEFFKEKMAQAEANKKNKSADKTCFSNFNMSFFNKKTRLKNKTINPDGHYYQMLKFSIEQLKAYQSMHQLDGIDEYLELTQDTKIIFCELNA